MWNEDIWGNVGEIIPIKVQGNRLIGDYMSATLYAKLFLTPLQKQINPGNNPAYPTGKYKRHAKVSRITGSTTYSIFLPVIILNKWSRSKSSQHIFLKSSRRKIPEESFCGCFMPRINGISHWQVCQYHQTNKIEGKGGIQIGLWSQIDDLKIF